MLFTVNWLNKIFPNVKGEVTDKKIDSILTDSRKKAKDSLFIPIVGENFDSHEFINQAYENGAIATLWEKGRKEPEGLPESFLVFYVDDTIKALQFLANAYRHEINPTVIGITGSNGKTTTKDIVASIAKEQYKTHFTNGNLNNELGLPFTILSMPRETEVLVLEMGMSSFGEIELLSNIAKPDYAVITNIGESHIEYLGSREGIAKAKLEIITGLSNTGKLIIDGDESLLNHVHQQDNVVKVGFSSKNDFVISNVEILHHKTTFTGSDGEDYTVSLLGSHHAKNSGYGIIIGKLLGIPKEKVKKALETLQLTGMRFELLKGRNDVSLINDAYNASPTSMMAAVEVVKQMDGFETKVVVLGDIYELGDQSKKLHANVANVINEQISVLYTVGNDSKAISDAVKGKFPNMTVKHIENKEDVPNELQDYLNNQTLILFKGSRGMELETVIRQLQ
ncbi:UDP-N-acetylmuramoyl-tripeptide--D-alanyl-D-alanine ligase [Ornithinibacillus halotolerans]|uniref:UDP-N-acetylmuramoyl-tripeptide--D-alanyl-D-alanine ligase n=1 Tax=Ornithinibacillus halotolerans TaxID=1274357 RepID=A0A916S515_9BACI|nr:UDP-N-acetylmuramoyl-tripeptide--D-alanyl-D-alanine ligase [Ornithinibacillus halotolerans]GGA83902.1 UDP-N-acetylmuramoyl-tripeptide--D-alanyl-D-alanine ligase [Ornithinibacillus halotolerans]